MFIDVLTECTAIRRRAPGITYDVDPTVDDYLLLRWALVALVLSPDVADPIQNATDTFRV